MAKKKTKTLPVKWHPKVLDRADNRLAAVKEMRRRTKQLQIDCNADSIQKQMLCSHAVFIHSMLETMARDALEEGQLDSSQYAVLTNALLALLKTLGVEKKAKALGLDAYIVSRRKGRKHEHR